MRDGHAPRDGRRRVARAARCSAVPYRDAGSESVNGHLTAAGNHRLKILAVDPILWAVGVLHADERCRTRHRDRDATKIDVFDVGKGISVRDAARLPHQIDDDLIGHADDDVLTHVVISDFGGRIVGEDRERVPDASDVFRRVVDQQIDIASEARAAVYDDRKPADEHIACSALVQRAAEPDEVFRFWCACVRRVISVIHLSASSKLANRYTPRGTSAAVPLNTAAVRASRPWSSTLGPSSRRFPATRMECIIARAALAVATLGGWAAAGTAVSASALVVFGAWAEPLFVVFRAAMLLPE